jgi:hypothetical protein
VLHFPTRQQLADIMTKGLPSALFDDFCTSLSIVTDARTAGVSTWLAPRALDRLPRGCQLGVLDIQDHARLAPRPPRSPRSAASARARCARGALPMYMYNILMRNTTMHCILLSFNSSSTWSLVSCLPFSLPRTSPFARARELGSNDSGGCARLW